jgi:hypothetical protein
VNTFNWRESAQQLNAAMWESAVGPGDFVAWLVYNAARAVTTPSTDFRAARQALGQHLLFPSARETYGEFLRREENRAAWQASVAQAKARNARMN